MLATLKTLFQKTLRLLWKAPKLWLPVLAADFLVYWVLLLFRYLSKLYFSSVYQSLSEDIRGDSFLDQHHSAILIGAISINFLRDFINVSLFYWAMVVVARAIVENGAISFDWSPPKKLFRNVCIFVLMYIAATSIVEVLSAPLRKQIIGDYKDIFVDLGTLLFSLIISVVAAPILSYLKSNIPVSSHENDGELNIKLPQLTAIAAVSTCSVIYTVLSIAMNYGLANLVLPVWFMKFKVLTYSIGIAASSVYNSPILIAMVALTLICIHQRKEIEPQADVASGSVEN